MAFDIEKMKADGVSSHLIELASMNQETFLLLIARRLENDKLFQQFLASNVGSIEAMYPYAVAAGLMSEWDREWLVDEGNPYKEIITYTVTFESCSYGGPYDPITVNAGESITLPIDMATGYPGWFDGGCYAQGNGVGAGGDSYTPTSSITLYAFEQEV